MFLYWVRTTNKIITSLVRALPENIALGLQQPRKLGRCFDRRQYFPVKPSSTGYYCIKINLNAVLGVSGSIPAPFKLEFVALLKT